MENQLSNTIYFAIKKEDKQGFFNSLMERKNLELKVITNMGHRPEKTKGVNFSVISIKAVKDNFKVKIITNDFPEIVIPGKYKMVINDNDFEKGACHAELTAK